MDLEQIRRVRSFNRTVTRRIGALTDDYLDRGRPLGEARLLFEIGPSGGDLRTLREKLGLDPGYMSRLLRSLERQHLIVTAASTADARVRRVQLTPRGLAEFRAYDKSSDDLAVAVLESLAANHRERLVTAMAEVERLLRAGAATIEIEDAASDDARHCLARFFEELARRFATGYDPVKGLPAGAELLNPPHGAFLVARLDGVPVGCVGLKRTGKSDAEVKRMWVAPDARGLGLGRRLLERIEELARASGVARLRLDTNSTLVEARALYENAGYREIADFNGEPYADQWFEKRLRPSRARPR
jgi:DNA-binding MarR family transcriptional regulator/GNAT superfamily N-acetyltransferase